MKSFDVDILIKKLKDDSTYAFASVIGIKAINGIPSGSEYQSHDGDVEIYFVEGEKSKISLVNDKLVWSVGVKSVGEKTRLLVTHEQREMWFGLLKKLKEAVSMLNESVGGFDSYFCCQYDNFKPIDDFDEISGVCKNMVSDKDVKTEPRLNSGTCKGCEEKDVPFDEYKFLDILREKLEQKGFEIIGAVCASKPKERNFYINGELDMYDKFFYPSFNKNKYSEGYYSGSVFDKHIVENFIAFKTKEDAIAFFDGVISRAGLDKVLSW